MTETESPTMKLLATISLTIATTLLLAFLFAETVQSQEAKQHPDARFLKWDSNKDNKLSRDELPTNIRRNFDRVDNDKNGEISLAEHLAFLNGRKSGQKRTQPQAKLPAGTTVSKDIAYVEGGHQRQKLDLYIPETASAENPVPLVIWVHGGGWKGGNKNSINRNVGSLLERGFAVASINYRLSGHAIFPAQIHDAKAAVRYLRKNAAKHGLDANKFGAWGSSAGGHLVALLGTSGDVKELEGTVGVTGVSSRVQAVCDWYGPIQLLKMNEQAGEHSALDHDAFDSPESLLIGGLIQENKDKTRKADPFQYVTSDDPPFLIMHGDNDRLVPVGQSKTFHSRLQEMKVPSELVIVKGAGHGFPREESNMQPIEFFTSQFLKKSNPNTNDKP